MDAIRDWRSSGRQQVFKLAGAAGTGKTTLITELFRDDPTVRFVSVTGKAASVLRHKGGTNATTMHRFLYGAPQIVDGDLVWEPQHDTEGASLIVADECSMIGYHLGRDLIDLDIQVVITGDDFQLPAIGDDPYFDGPADFTLTEIHRQAQGSQPLQIATAIRQEGRLPEPVPFKMRTLLEADTVICATNKVRMAVNSLWRREASAEVRTCHPEDRRIPREGEQVLCFRNNYERGVLNGEVWTVAEVHQDGDNFRLSLIDDINNQTQVVAPAIYFHIGAHRAPRMRDEFDLFDFGYCLTAHKAQASEWPRVCVLDERRSRGLPYMARNQYSISADEFIRRWFYSAVTRASEHVTVMEPP
jgi:exodeoxyribonuclease-5